MALSVAIIGRPNVGKSTLFNRLAGKKLALVDDQPGVTRDRREGDGELAGLTLHLIDTAGLEEAAKGSLEARMRAQTERAVDDADVALLLIDSRAGITPLDEHFAGWLRAKDTPVVLAANKCEGRAGEAGYYEAFSLGTAWPSSMPRWRRLTRRRNRRRRKTRMTATNARVPCNWPSSGVPTSASRHW